MPIPPTDPHWQLINTDNGRATGNEAMAKLAELSIEDLQKITE
jgi:hypothetical protein